MKAHYTTAVLELLDTDADVSRVEEVIEQLKSVLAARGHARLLPPILRAVAKRLAHTASSDVIVTLRRASDSEYKKYESHINASGLSFDPQHIVLDEDPTIIGGFTLTVKDKMIDRSYKSQLLTLYRNITT